MAKLVLFLKTDVLPREKHTSTRLVELKDLLIIRFYTIFAPKIFKRTRVWTDYLVHRAKNRKEK